MDGGEPLSLYVDGEEIVTNYFNAWNPSEGNIYFHNGNLSIYRFEYTVPHSATDITVSFTGSSMEDINNESWGIDNFSCVPYQGSSPAASSLHITAWEADPDNGLDGFTAGNPMSFKVYASVYDNMIEMNPDVTWHVGDQNFGTGQFSVVELHAISGVDPVIRLDQASLAFPPVVTGQTWGGHLIYI